MEVRGASIIKIIIVIVIIRSVEVMSVELEVRRLVA